MAILKKITEIKNYKSYHCYRWDEFEKYEKYDKNTGGKKEVVAEFFCSAGAHAPAVTERLWVRENIIH